MRKGIGAIDLIDFCDHDKLEKLHERRAKEWLKLFSKVKQGDQKGILDFKKHEAEDKVLRAKASETGYYWT